MKYNYFVSYSFLSADQSASGFGNFDCETHKPITTFKDINEAAQRISRKIAKDQFIQVNCIILNYILLSQTEE